MSRFSKLRKISIIGTTGSGKTSFLKAIVAYANDAFDEIGEIERKIREEDAQVQTFSVIDPKLWVGSTTTISLNAHNLIFLTTRNGSFKVYSMRMDRIPIPIDFIKEAYPIVFFDLPGQDRFNFMQELGIRGSDAVLIFADGSNVASLQRVSNYIKVAKSEFRDIEDSPPICVFVNKADLDEKGIFVGKSALESWIEEEKIPVYETSIFKMDDFLEPLKEVFQKVDGFPMDIKDILRKD